MSALAKGTPDKSIHLRALKIALLVGTILAAINYGDKIWLGTMSLSDWFKLGVTYGVPYLVSLYSGLNAAKK